MKNKLKKIGAYAIAVFFMVLGVTSGIVCFCTHTAIGYICGVLNLLTVLLLVYAFIVFIKEYCNN